MSEAEGVLLPYQQRWIADQSSLKLAEKSRRTGLTWAEAADAVLAAAAADGGVSHLYLGAGKEMAQEFIEAAAMWARTFDQAAGEIEEEILPDGDRDILTYRINFASGQKVQALSSNPSNLRGRKGNVTIDEAAFHPDLAEVLKAALPLRMWGGKVRLISTHNGARNPFNELVEDSRAGKQPYSVHRITLDDACREGLYRRICQVNGREWSPEAEAEWKEELMRGSLTREDALEEYCCVPKQSGGAYLSRALIEACMVEAPVLRFESPSGFDVWGERLREQEVAGWCEENLLPLLEQLDPDEPHCFGEDFGRVADPHCSSAAGHRQQARPPGAVPDRACEMSPTGSRSRSSITWSTGCRASGPAPSTPAATEAIWPSRPPTATDATGSNPWRRARPGTWRTCPGSRLGSRTRNC